MIDQVFLKVFGDLLMASSSQFACHERCILVFGIEFYLNFEAINELILTYTRLRYMLRILKELSVQGHNTFTQGRSQWGGRQVPGLPQLVQPSGPALASGEAVNGETKERCINLEET